MGYLIKTLLAVVFLFPSTVVFAQQDIINKIKEGGYNIFFRHSITPGSDSKKHNPPGENIFNCATQRSLNDEGKEQAKLIGINFKKFDIPVGDVYSSVICRCDETARLAFGKSKSVIWLVAGPQMSFAPEIKKAVETLPAPGTNNIFVGHANTLSNQMLGNIYPKIFLQEGEAVVFDPKTLSIVGRIHPSKW